MLSRTWKAAYFGLMYCPMRVNAWRHRTFMRPSGLLKVQLGPGRRNYLPSWTNVDANFLTAKIDIWADISATLPFRSESVDAFYSHHVIEHLTDSLLPFHFAELHRSLKPGGVIRIAGPNGDMAIRKFTESDPSWFDDFPDNRRSIGGRFANFILCRGEHLTILTHSYLAELATDAGFEAIRFVQPVSETNFPAAFDGAVLSHEWESTPDCPHTLVLEARKPSDALVPDPPTHRAARAQPDTDR
jgi:predicted SAM-dependent methyltransferase